MKKTHGMTNTAEYRTWSSIKQRCNNPNDAGYKDYGGRGIKMCERWQNNFEAFYADIGDRPDGMTLERIDNSKGYSPENCRWATRTDQQNNRRNNRLIAGSDRTMTLAQWKRESASMEHGLTDNLY